MIVVADTSPLNYLILIRQIDVLPVLFGKIVLPRSVHEELLDPSSPERVRVWAGDLPEWTKVRSAARPPDPLLNHLGRGEREAILIAEEIQANRLIIDDQQGRQAAHRRGIETIRTLAILRAAEAEGLLDLPSAIESLRKTSFFLADDVLAQFLKKKP